MSTLIERLLAKSTPVGDCLVWTGATDDCGYGRIIVNGHKLRVHRAAWIERHGPIPAATPHVLHRCDNPPCWADGHLFLGTHADNMADMRRKGRARRAPVLDHCSHGHPFTEANTYVAPRSGKRSCLTCRRTYRARLAASTRCD